MKKLKQFLRDIFEPESFNDLDVGSIGAALNDPGIRSLWLSYCLEELKAINQEVDRRLLVGPEMGLTDLCARRKAFQDILEAIPAQKRRLTQDPRPNPRPRVEVNLDRVTA